MVEDSISINLDIASLRLTYTPERQHLMYRRRASNSQATHILSFLTLFLCERNVELGKIT